MARTTRLDEVLALTHTARGLVLGRGPHAERRSPTPGGMALLRQIIACQGEFRLETSLLGREAHRGEEACRSLSALAPAEP